MEQQQFTAQFTISSSLISWHWTLKFKFKEIQFSMYGMSVSIISADYRRWHPRHWLSHNWASRVINIRRVQEKTFSLFFKVFKCQRKNSSSEKNTTHQPTWTNGLSYFNLLSRNAINLLPLSYKRLSNRNIEICCKWSEIVGINITATRSSIFLLCSRKIQSCRKHFKVSALGFEFLLHH